MKYVRFTKDFERDGKRMRKRGKNLDKLYQVVEFLQYDKPLPVRCRPHKLVGGYSGYWDCHIEPDWLLLYRFEGSDLILERTGTHADLFK